MKVTAAKSSHYRIADNCYFCQAIKSSEPSLAIIPDLELGTFVAAYDLYPVTPGHALIIPKRHVQFMKDLRDEESAALFDAVARTKEYLMTADLPAVYERMAPSAAGTGAEAYIAHSRKLLAGFNHPPDSFNDGVNDGPAAGQTISHFHWHVMPRWQGDVADPRGGVRHMFAGMGNYREGMAAGA